MSYTEVGLYSLASSGTINQEVSVALRYGIIPSASWLLIFEQTSTSSGLLATIQSHNQGLKRIFDMRAARQAANL